MVWDTEKKKKMAEPSLSKRILFFARNMQKKENEGHMKKYKHVFYSVVGNHAGETVEQIINRKKKEINKCGYSLWSIKMNKKSLEQVWELPEDSEVVVIAKTNPKAKDPVIRL